MIRQHYKKKKPSASRKGAAVVEFALIAPLFLVLVLGTVEIGRATDVGATLSQAVREGGRLGSMDFGPLIPAGQTANQKVINDVKNMLSASGIPGASVTVTITHAGGANDGSTFDLEDPANYLEHFRVTASVPFTAVSVFPLQIVGSSTIKSEIVFRLGHSNISG